MKKYRGFCDNFLKSPKAADVTSHLLQVGNTYAVSPDRQEPRHLSAYIQFHLFKYSLLK